MNNREFANVVGWVGGTWSSWEARDETVMVLRACVGDLDEGPVIDAIRTLGLEHPQFAPTPQTIAARARELLGPTRSRGQAFGAIVAEIGRAGYVGTPIFDDPLVYLLVAQLGGWRHLCETWTTDDEMANRAHVLRLYDDLTTRERHGENLIPAAVAAFERCYAEALSCEMARVPAFASRRREIDA